MSKLLQDCIYNCSNCHNVCLETVRHCLRKGGELAKQKHIALMMDCADICTTTGNFMLRQSSSLHQDACALCAQVASMCAVYCESIAGDDPQLLKCMESCRQCAQSCEEVAAETI